MPYPSKSDVEYLQAYLETPDMGPFIMSGTDADIWGSLEEYRAPVPDLVALYGRHNEDPFSKWVTSTGMDIFFRCGFSRWRKPSRVSGITGYPESTLLRITRWISSIIASLLPVLSIIVFILCGFHAGSTRYYRLIQCVRFPLSTRLHKRKEQ